MGLTRKCVRRQEALPTWLTVAAMMATPHRSSPLRLGAHALGAPAPSLPPSQAG